MAKRRRRRKRTHNKTNRSKKIREGRAIINDTPDDKSAAHLMGEIYNEDKDSVLDATDLNESLKYFKYKRHHK